MNYKYGEEISYDYQLIKPGDEVALWAFKLHYDYYSEQSKEPDDHYYFSDDIMGTFIRHCRDISNEKAIAHYIVLYADKNVKRFYVRNMFSDFASFMVKEQNMQISANDPMYMKLD